MFSTSYRVDAQSLANCQEIYFGDLNSIFAIRGKYFKSSTLGNLTVFEKLKLALVEAL